MLQFSYIKQEDLCIKCIELTWNCSISCKMLTGSYNIQRKSTVHKLCQSIDSLTPFLRTFSRCVKIVRRVVLSPIWYVNVFINVNIFLLLFLLMCECECYYVLSYCLDGFTNKLFVHFVLLSLSVPMKTIT